MVETEELKELANKLTYLKAVVNETENKSNLDKNIIYEITYSHIMLKHYLETDIKDEVILHEIQSLYNSFDILLNSIQDSKAQEALDNNKITNLSKIDKIKYNVESKGFNGTYKEKSYALIDSNDQIKEYFKTCGIQKLIILISAFIFYTYGKQILQAILSIIQLGTLESNVSFTLVSLTEAISLIVFILSAFMILYILLRLSVDIMYITLPFIRGIVKNTSIIHFISDDAKNVCDTTYTNEVITFKKVVEKDRIKRNIGILECMLLEYPNSSILNSLKSDALDVKQYGKKYYYSLAKIEFIYDKVLQGNIDLLN